MNRRQAIRIVMDQVGPSLLITANGYHARYVYEFDDRPENFYMLGSMGLASSIALGIAIAQPQRKIIVLDGDGNLLMNLGSLAMVAERGTRNLVHVVLDNGVYGSTGGQRCISDSVCLASLAQAAGYGTVDKVDSTEGLSTRLDDMLQGSGPSFLLARISNEEDAVALPRVGRSPAEISERFRQACTQWEPPALGRVPRSDHPRVEARFEELGP